MSITLLSEVRLDLTGAGDKVCRRKYNFADASRNEKTTLVLNSHAAGRSPCEIIRMYPQISRDQIYGIMSYRGLKSHPDAKVKSDRDSERDREIDALCESGEPDRRAMAYRIASMGGTAEMIKLELGCELEVAERYANECPAKWLTFSD